MKLPGAEYNRGMSGLGRDSSDPTAVSRAEYEAASAKGRIASAMNQTAGVAEAWAFAEDQLKASQAASEYAQVMAKTVEHLKSAPTVKAEHLPPGALKDGDEREEVPTWEVAPAIYDAVEKEAYTKAAKAPQNRRVRQELETQLGSQRVRNGAAVSTFYVSAKRKDMEGKFDEAVKQAVQAGTPELAIAHVDNAVKAGIFDYKEGVTKKEKVLHDVEDLKVARAIAESNDSAQLEQVGNSVLMNNQSRLTPDERRGYANQAQSKADRIEKAAEKKTEKEQRERSKEILGTLATRIRLEGYIPKASELVDAKTVLNPADYLALIALVDRKDGGNGGLGSTDMSTARDLQKQIMALSYPQAGISADKQSNMVYDQIMTAFSQGKLSLKDREAYVLQLERYRDRPLRRSPEYAMAEDKIEATILPPKGLAATMDFKDATLYGAVATDMKLALADATRKDPNLDPRMWVDQNLPTYRARVGAAGTAALHTMGMSTYVRTNKDGAFDVDQTVAAIEEARRQHRLGEADAVRAINAAKAAGGTAQPPTPGQKRGVRAQ